MGGSVFILSCGRVILRNNTNKNNNCSTNMMDDYECFDSSVIDSLLICLNLYPE